MQLKEWDKIVNLLPELSTSEKEALESSIKSHGVLQPVTILPDGRILDGYHRWRIAGNDTPYKIVELDEEVAFATALQLNLSRRNLSPEQRAEVIKSLRKQGYSQQRIAEMLGVTQVRVSQVESEDTDISNINTYNTYIPDLRLKVPRSEHEKIYEMHQEGHTQEAIASEYKLTQPRVAQIINKLEKKGSNSKEELPETAGTTRSLQLGDFRDLIQSIPNESIDLVLTDPPYPKEYLPLWTDLAKESARVLKPGKFLIAYSGQNHLVEVLNRLSEHLQYYWLGMLYHKGQTAQRFEVNMWNRAKPILFFCKPPRVKQDTWIEDVVESPEADKDFHTWGQSAKPLIHLIETFSSVGDIILEPFAGGGATLRACDLTERNFMAYEIDEKAYKTTKERLNL